VIVVDTNILAYAVLPGEKTAAALALVERDPFWVAPALWRRELRNVLATLMRVRRLPLPSALAAFAEAERLVTDVSIEPTTQDCLRLAARGRVSAWDAEFVFVADALGAPLVSADKRLMRAFPGRVVSLTEMAAGRQLFRGLALARHDRQHQG
jgi:predicted nucleic acid-binding protein